MQKMMKSLGPGLTQVMKGGGGKLKQANAMRKAVKAGDIDADQLRALQDGGLPGMGGLGLPGGSRPKPPSLPGLGGGRPGGGRVTPPGTQSGPSNKKKKKKR